MLRIFTPVKIQRLRPGLNLQTWVPETSMLTTRPPKPSIADVTENVLLQVPKKCLELLDRIIALPGIANFNICFVTLYVLTLHINCDQL